MSSMRNLKDVIKDTLVKTGALSEIEARIRSEVFHVLQEDTEPPPPLSKENILINELIREYLVYNGYLYAESVLIAESGQPHLQLPRSHMEEQLNIKSSKETENMPILYELISHFRKEKKSPMEPQSSSNA